MSISSPADLIESIDRAVPLDPEVKIELIELVSLEGRTSEQDERLKGLLELLELEANIEYGKTLVDQELDRQADERLDALEARLESDAQAIEPFMEAFIKEDRQAEEEEAVDEARKSIDQA